LLCWLEEKEKGKEDENDCIGRGELGCMLPWIETSSLGLSYLMVITSARRRVHHRSGCTTTW
jgi:hypothetical protein